MHETPRSLEFGEWFTGVTAITPHGPRGRVLVVRGTGGRWIGTVYKRLVVAPRFPFVTIVDIR